MIDNNASLYVMFLQVGGHWERPKGRALKTRSDRDRRPESGFSPSREMRFGVHGKQERKTDKRQTESNGGNGDVGKIVDKMDVNMKEEGTAAMRQYLCPNMVRFVRLLRGWRRRDGCGECAWKCFRRLIQRCRKRGLLRCDNFLVRS